MRTLCIDFDGVLHSYVSGWKGADRVDDPPVPGAMRFLVDATHHFEEVAVYSSRSKEAGGIEIMATAIQSWLAEENLMDVSEAYHFVMKRLTFPREKPAAWLTIDDRCICFDGTFPSFDIINTFRPWNKR